MIARTLLSAFAALFVATGVACAQPVETDAPIALITRDDGSTLFAKNADEPTAPASITKLMSAAVVFDLLKQGQIQPDTMFQVSRRAWRTGGSKMFVLVDTEISVENLLKGVVIVSGNDATVVLAENIAGSEAAFVDLMNGRAQEWGLKNSHFQNATGVDEEGHYMTANDMARLARHVWESYPEWRYLFSEPDFTWSDIFQRNRNPLLTTFEGADGLKTGHTDNAGYAIVGSASRDGQRRYLVLAGLESDGARRRESDRMMGIGYDRFPTRTVLGADEIIGEADVYGGLATSVPLKMGRRVVLTRRNDVLESATAKLRYQGPLKAPIREGDQVAILELSLPGERARELPVYAAGDVKAQGPFRKIGDGLSMMFTPPSAAEVQ